MTINLIKGNNTATVMRIMRENGLGFYAEEETWDRLPRLIFTAETCGEETRRAEVTFNWEGTKAVDLSYWEATDLF